VDRAAIQIGEMVAEEFENVAAFRQRQALGDLSLQLDRTNFRAILLCVGTALGGFIVVEIIAVSEEGRGRGSGSSSKRR